MGVWFFVFYGVRESSFVGTSEMSLLWRMNMVGVLARPGTMVLVCFFLFFIFFSCVLRVCVGVCEWVEFFSSFMVSARVVFFPPMKTFWCVGDE